MEHSSYARRAYTAEIERVEHDLLLMGARAEAMVGQAVDALVSLDRVLARKVLEEDDEVDQLDLHIEDRCIKLLALQHPMAADLLFISTALKMITDIERIGDLAVDIAKIELKLENEFGASDIIDIPRIGKVAQKMIRESLEAYVKRDLELARQVCIQDDIVDQLYRELRGQIFESMKRDPENVIIDSWLLLAIHHVERIADHAVNIAERVAFMMTGRFEQLAKSHRLEDLN